MRNFATSILMTMALAVPGRATSFYAISGDPNNSFVPDQFSLITNSVNLISTLGNGSLAFNGGLTVADNGLFSIANDSGDNSSFYSISAGGVASLIGSAGGLGTGFLNGLTFDPNTGNFYAVSFTSGGASELFAIDPTTGNPTDQNQDLASAFSDNIAFNSIAFDTASSQFFGIANDGSGNSSLYSFSIGGSTNLVAALGTGFGSLTFDSANNVFWALSPVNNAGTQLFQISPTGTVSSPVMTLGDGFVELAAQTPAAPEPTTMGLIAIGLALVAWRKSPGERVR